jgi:hypothetical protein
MSRFTERFSLGCFSKPSFMSLFLRHVLLRTSHRESEPLDHSIGMSMRRDHNSASLPLLIHLLNCVIAEGREQDGGVNAMKALACLPPKVAAI